MRFPSAVVLALGVLAAVPVSAEMQLPPGFTSRVYVTGEGFDAASSRGMRGIPSSSTLAVDDEGTAYLARTGRRYVGGEVEDIFQIYRIPAGGAQISPASEARFFFGPPLPNPQVATVRGGREVFVTTFDRDRKVGVLYRVVGRDIELFAGGTPPRGAAPLLKQPEGVAVDARGHVYVADREQGTVLRLDASGRVLDPAWMKASRPRLVVAGAEEVWVASDGTAEAPWQRGPGEIWRIPGEAPPAMLLRGPLATGMVVAPGGPVLVADRQGAEVFLLDAQGRRTTFARFTDGDAPRTLAFVPSSPATRAAGLAGDLLIVVISKGAWPVNEVLRISGPFEEWVRRLRPAGE
jgi:hypothetical protein